MNKVDFLKCCKKIASEYGMTDDDFVALKTTGYFQSVLNELHDFSYAKAEENIRERHLITAEKKHSLLKEGYATDGVLFSNFATPSYAGFMLVFPIEELIVMDVRDDYIDADGATHKIFKKDTSYISLAGFTYSFLYDFEIVLKVNTATTAYPYPYRVRANYITDDEYHPLDVNNEMDKPINAFYVVSSDIVSQMGNKECVALVLNLPQIKTVIRETKYYLTDNENAIKMVSYDDMLVEFSTKYKAITDDKYRTLNKVASYNKISIDKETVFYKIIDDNNFAVINRAYGNFEPTNNSSLKVECYVTKGKEGSFTYSGTDIMFMSEESIASRVYLMSNPTGGKDTPTISELRNKLLLATNVVGTINNTRDFKKYLEIYSNDGYLTMKKSRHDNIEMCNDITVFLTSSEGDIIPTNTIDVNIDLTREVLSDDGSYYILTPTIYSYKYGFGYNRQMSADDTDTLTHVYVTPFVMIYNRLTNTLSPFNRLVNKTHQMSFDYVDKDADLFTIINRIYVRKHPNAKPYMSFNLLTSTGVNGNAELHTISETMGNMVDTDRVRVYCVVYTHGVIVGYIKATMIGYSESEFYYRYNVDEFITSEYPDAGNINVTLKSIKYGTDTDYIIPYDDIKVEILVFLKDENVNDKTIPNNLGYRLVNKFTAEDMAFFSEVSELHKISVKNISSTQIVLNQLPVVQDDYYRMKFIDVHNEIDKQHSSMAGVVNRFFENTSTRIKFANTYGFSNRYKIGIDKQILDNVAIAMMFNVKFGTGLKLSSYSAEDIKFTIIKYIKSVDFKNGEKLHVSKIIDTVYNEYGDFIEYFEFDNINDYPSRYQLIMLDTDVTEDVFDKSVFEIISPRISVDYDSMSLVYDITVNTL